MTHLVEIRLLIYLATGLLNRTAENSAYLAQPDGILSNLDLACA